MKFLRNRSSVILIEHDKVALIKRIRDGSIYYVFPGGGIEDGETPAEGAKREALEELGIEVNVKECISEVDFNGTQYFFLTEWKSGTFGTGQGEEFTVVQRNRGIYLPVWVDIDELPSIDVRPREADLIVQSLFKNERESELIPGEKRKFQ
jgi:8-oxo-dGTP diphosphatase